MGALRNLAILAGVLAAAASALEVTPVEKVINLISDMKKQTEEEGKAEAKTYDEFACFCKDTTAKKSKSITDGQDNIDTLSATIEDKTATKEEKMTEKADRQKNQEALARKLADTKAELAKATAEYEVRAADTNKALSSLEGALKDIEASKPASAAALLQVQQKAIDKLDISDAVSLDLGVQMGLKAKRHSDIIAFIQQGTHAKVDPDDAEYHSHTGGIVKTVEELQVDYRAQKAKLDSEWADQKKSLEDTIKDTTEEMDANKASMTQLDADISTLSMEISEARENLVMAQSGLTDDEAYLKDLTARCADRANDWDQRAAMRRDELAALSKAIEILENKVKSADEAANKRASLLAKSSSSVDSDISFVQVSETHKVAKNLLERVVAKRTDTGIATVMQARQMKVATMLQGEAKRLGSTVLASVGMKVAADPMAKVKELIQKLIERLVKEASEEASKKGFCDTELGKAKHDRDYRLMDVDKLSVTLKGLEAKQEGLEIEISQLTKTLTELDGFLAEQTKLRAEEKAENMATLKEAKGGLAAVTDALSVLKSFYKKAARASALIQASPVDDDTAGAGFSGSYKGNQEGSKAILGLLDVIKSDFERTVKVTTETEAKNAAAFVKTDQTTKADIAGKTTKKKLDEEDLTTTKMKIEKGMGELQENMDLLDKALMELEELKPACIDTGMSYEERVQKREDEMAALKKSMCMLDAEGVEPECS